MEKECGVPGEKPYVRQLPRPLEEVVRAHALSQPPTENRHGGYVLEEQRQTMPRSASEYPQP